MDIYPDIACASGLSLQAEKRPFDWDFRSRTALPRYARDDLLECKFWSGLNGGHPLQSSSGSRRVNSQKNVFKCDPKMMKVLAETSGE